jgi:hypothetical protein
MLDRSIPTRKALIHSIPISEVKDMASDLLRALKASLSQKTLNLNFCKIDFEFLSATFPPLESTFLKSI